MNMRILFAAWLLIGGLAALGRAETDESETDATKQEEPSGTAEQPDSDDKDSTGAEDSDEDAATTPSKQGRSDKSSRSTFAPSDADDEDRSSSSRRETRRSGSDEDRRADRERTNRSSTRDRDESRRSGRDDAERDRRSVSKPGEQMGRALASQLGLSFDETDDGLVVANVSARGSAARFGIRVGDRVLTVNGEQIDSEKDFERWTNEDRGSKIPVVVWRDGSRRTIFWSGGDRLSRATSRDSDRRGRQDESSEDEAGQGSAFLGVVFDTRYDDAAVVRQVYRGSPAQQAGVRGGDTILSVNGKQVSSSDEVSDAVADMEPGDHIDLMVSHAPPRMMEVRLGSRSEQHEAAYRGESSEEDSGSTDDSAESSEPKNRSSDEQGERRNAFGRWFGRD